MSPAPDSILEVLRPSNLIFFGLAALTILGGIGVAFSRNIVYSAFSLLASLIGVAALFAWLSADYLAITQLVVYVGGTLILFLFAVMLTSKIREVRGSNPIIGLAPALVLGAALAAFLTYISLETPWSLLPKPNPRPTTALLGDALLTQYLLPFEVLSLLILAALVGAVMIARKEVKEAP